MNGLNALLACPIDTQSLGISLENAAAAACADVVRKRSFSTSEYFQKGGQNHGY